MRERHVYHVSRANTAETHSQIVPVRHRGNNTYCEIIHIDLCGPMKVNSLGGVKYFFLLKDDCSHFRVVYFLKNKNEVYDRLENFIEKTENITGIKIKIVRSDNAKELTTTKLKTLLDKKGITHQTSVIYTPEQNGKVEREMRTVVETARTMLLTKNLPKSL